MFSRDYSLYKSQQILRETLKIYERQKEQLPELTRTKMGLLLSSLQEAILLKNRHQADREARQLEEITAPYVQRNPARLIWEFVSTIVIALCIATLIRQTWFEPYQIPTGSMRPTFREKDCVAVTKTAFGINTPLSTSHLYFDPSLVKRTGVFTFTSDGLDMKDTDTQYFWLFPAKKQLIKRCMGLPGDVLYFYGGKLYGINAAGEDISPLLNPSWMQSLEYIPYMSFLGRTSTKKAEESQSGQQEMWLRQMNIPLGKFTFSPRGIQGLIHRGNTWIADNPYEASRPHTEPLTYSDFFGIGNFAMARLLTAKEAEKLWSAQIVKMAKAPFYLELYHHPSLSYPPPRADKNLDGSLHLSLPGFSSLLPLQNTHIDNLRKALYTMRFVVSNGKATVYAVEGSTFDRWSVSMPKVPDGTYEFYHGNAYEVGIGGWLTELGNAHPLVQFADQHIQELFNLGMDWHTLFAVHGKNPLNLPSRYAYFREGALYVMGSALMQPQDTLLQTFVANEKEKQANSTTFAPYLGFFDQGPPYRNGKIDSDFIRSFGVEIPAKGYLALGDNHARSSDSRYFGFVPEDNLKGAPSLIFWPPGPRWGAPLQFPYPFMNLPRAIIWGIAGLVLLAWWLYRRIRLGQRIYHGQ